MAIWKVLNSMKKFGFKNKDFSSYESITRIKKICGKSSRKFRFEDGREFVREQAAKTRRPGGG